MEPFSTFWTHFQIFTLPVNWFEKTFFSNTPRQTKAKLTLPSLGTPRPTMTKFTFQMLWEFALFFQPHNIYVPFLSIRNLIYSGAAGACAGRPKVLGASEAGIETSHPLQKTDPATNVTPFLWSERPPKPATLNFIFDRFFTILHVFGRCQLEFGFRTHDPEIFVCTEFSRTIWTQYFQTRMSILSVKVRHKAVETHSCTMRHGPNTN